MIADSIKFKGHRCFKLHWAGFDCFKPVNIIIGKNNTGKSRLLDLVESLLQSDKKSWAWRCLWRGILDEASLKRAFSPDTSGGDLGGNFWNNHGRFLIDTPISWETNESGVVTNIYADEPSSLALGLPNNSGTQEIVSARKARIGAVCTMAESALTRKRCMRLFAERDIVPESPNVGLSLNGNGSGASNIVRRYLNSSSANVSRDLIEVVLLDALNHVFRGDGKFTSISIQEHDEPNQGTWEIVLTEANKGRIPLSQSGSGLKTVLLVLLNLLVMPQIHKSREESCVFVFEELENNLHPSLLRRLFSFIEEYVLQKRSMVFFTTHSSVALDVFGPAKHAQIIHVSHDGESAKTTTVSAHFDKLSVLADLGAKPSDLLQANGVLWVEGPSDRIYLNRWIDLASRGKFREGRDYQCAFFGGTLLANTQFTEPETGNPDFANLLQLNSNFVIVCDSDRTAAIGEGSALKKRVQRIQVEVAKNAAGYLWVTEAKEIENYFPLSALQKLRDSVTMPPGQFDHIFPCASIDEGESYYKKVFDKKTFSKVELASEIAPHMTKEDMEQRFDWKAQLDAIIAMIDKWNR